MEIVPLTQTETVIDVAIKVRPLLHRGKTPTTMSEIYAILDVSDTDAQYGLVRHIIDLLKGDVAAAMKFVRDQYRMDYPREFYHAYGRLLVDVAIYKLLARDSHADIVEKALQEAAFCFYNRSEDLDMIQFVEILELAATGKIDQAWSLHRRMTQTWLHARSEVVLQWKLVLDMAILRATGSTAILQEILRSPVASRHTRHQASELHRKLQAKSWFVRQVHKLRVITGYTPHSTT